MLDPIQTMKNFEAADDYIAQLKRELAEARIEIANRAHFEQAYIKERDTLRAELARMNAIKDGVMSTLVGIHALLYPEKITRDDGVAFVFHSPYVHEQMQALSDRIRAIPEALRAELARVNADAARYQFLRIRATARGYSVSFTYAIDPKVGQGFRVLQPEELDTLIDGGMRVSEELRAARQPEQPQSEDDKALTALVDEFAAEMKLKLLAKRREGNWGWDNPENRDKIEHGLFAHLKRPGQWIDVANYAAFLWNIDRQPEQGDPI